MNKLPWIFASTICKINTQLMVQSEPWSYNYCSDLFERKREEICFRGSFVPTFLKERGRKYVFGVVFPNIFVNFKFDSKELKFTPNERYRFSESKKQHALKISHSFILFRGFKNQIRIKTLLWINNMSAFLYATDRILCAAVVEYILQSESQLVIRSYE